MDDSYVKMLMIKMMGDKDKMGNQDMAMRGMRKDMTSSSRNNVWESMGKNMADVGTDDARKQFMMGMKRGY